MKTAIHFSNFVKMSHGKSLRIQQLNVSEKECLAFYGLPDDFAELLINSMTCAYPPEEGSISIYGKDSRTLSEEMWFEFLGRFGVFASGARLQENASIGENLATVYRTRDPMMNETRLSSSVLKIANLVQLTITDLSKIMSEASQLLRMKARLGRALALHPKLLLLREPTADLSRDVAQKLVPLVRNARRKLKPTIVIFSRDGWLLQELADRVVFLNPESGAIVENSLRGWYHYLLPFLKPTRTKRLELTRDISKYGTKKSTKVL